MKALILVGLPGSGKTWLANKLARYKPYIIIDDPFDFQGDIIDKLSQGIDCIICDPYACAESTRETMESVLLENGYAVDYIFFENNPEKCQVNANYRDDDRRVDITIKALTEMYQIPDGYEAREIWQPWN